MWSFKFVLSLLCLINILNATPIECETDDEQLRQFCGCIESDGKYEMQWDQHISKDKACKCSPILVIDNMINYWDVHYCQSRFVKQNSYFLI